MNKSESIKEINNALSEFQKNVVQPLKDANNPFFKSKYVPLENVVQAINDVAPKHGLSFTQWAVNNEKGEVGVATMLMHKSGEFIEYPAIYSKPDKPNAQGLGSAITYLKRYTLSAIFGITSDQDDDGNQASGNNNQAPPQKKIGKEIVLTKYKLGSGSDDGFEEWYETQVGKGVTNNQMDEFLTNAIKEKEKNKNV